MEIKIKGNKIFAPLLDKWLNLTSEEKLKQEFINDLINKYSYQIPQLGQDISINNNEKIDIAIWRNQEDKQNGEVPAIVIAIDCSAEWSKITQNEAKKKYSALTLNTDFLVIKNLRETRIYHVERGKSIDQFSHIIELPDIRAIRNESTIKDFIKNKKDYSKEKFNQVLSKCHNIIRNNDKLSPEAAFDEMSKMLFIKYEYEKEHKGEIVLSKNHFLEEERQFSEANKSLNISISSDDYMQKRFAAVKERLKNEELFDSAERIKIRRNSFEQILEELEIFNLIKIDDDIKGLAFESFLSRTFRGELGQFFTPRPVVEFMVNILDPCEGELICDPCCGSGGFLITAFNYIREKIETDIKSVLSHVINKELNGQSMTDTYSLSESINKEWDKGNAKGRFFQLSHNCIFGTDANPRMARTAKMNMIMHGDGHGGVHHHDGLINVNGIWDNKFDVILTNPPFGAKLDKSMLITNDDIPSEREIAAYVQKYGDTYIEKVVTPLKNSAEYNSGTNKSRGKSIISFFESGKYSGLTEVLFIERCINLLKPGGRMGIVLPEGVLNNANLQIVRELFEKRAKIVLITSIPQDVFMASGANVKPSLVFLKKFTLEEEKLYESIVKKTIQEVNVKYTEQTEELKRTKQRIELKNLEKTKKEQINQLVRERFDYTIPIAQVQKAGITTTGGECENELYVLQDEFASYRMQNELWADLHLDYTYLVKDGKLMRKLNDEGWIELC